ncbi:MAG: hypothetical protein U0941_24760 [Planctomycetaceae bacterium]
MRNLVAITWVLSLWLGIEHSLKAADPPTPKAATVADAVKVLDLMNMSLIKGADQSVNRTAGRLSYSATGNCKAAFEFHRQALLKQKWTEQPGTAVTDQYASGVFTKSGFACSLSTSPLDAGKVNVMLMLHGNVDLQKLPMPKGSKVTYAGPQIAMFNSALSVEAATAECQKQLVAAGWIPYGQAGPSSFFRQNAVLINVMVSEAPAAMGKTMINVSSEQLSAEIPAPNETVQLQYSDITKELLFDTKESEAFVDKFYRETLSKTGWKATTDKPFQIDFKHGLIFRNDAKEMLELEMYPVKDEKVLRVTVKHKSKAEVDTEEKAFQEAQAKNKNKPMPKLGTVKITPPSGANIAESSTRKLEFTVTTGKGKASVAEIRKALTSAGWKEKVTTDDGMIGLIDFEKGEQTISLKYVDPGFIPAEVTINGSGVELEKVGK